MSQGNTKYFQPTAMQPHPYDPSKPINSTDINNLNYPGQGMQDVPTPFNPATTIYGAGPNSRTKPYNSPNYPPGTRILEHPSNGIGGGGADLFDAEGKPIGGWSYSGMGGGGPARPTPATPATPATPGVSPATPATPAVGVGAQRRTSTPGTTYTSPGFSMAAGANPISQAMQQYQANLRSQVPQQYQQYLPSNFAF